MSSVYPSGAALATRAPPAMPAAAPTFSITIVCPNSSPMRCAWMRALTSMPPPAANGTTSVIGRLGHSSPAATAVRAIVAAAAALIRLSMGFSLSAAASRPSPAGSRLTLSRRPRQRAVRRPARRACLAALECRRARASPLRGSSVETDAGRPDRRGPFLDLAGDELGEIVRRPALGRNESHVKLAHPVPQRRRIQRLDHRSIELVDDRRGRALGQKERRPAQRFKIGEPLLVRGGECRQQRRAL